MVHSRHEAPAAPSAAALSTTVRSDGSLRGLRAPPSTALPDSDAAWPWVVWPVAVEPRGRRTEDAALVTPSLAEALAAAASRLVPILDHAGPRAARWSKERPVGASDAAEPQSGRKAEPLDDDGWRAVVAFFGEAAATLRAGGVRAALLGVDDDGLLQATLSPRTNPGTTLPERLARVLPCFHAMRAHLDDVGVALIVEELSPRGLDATEGIEVARAFVEAGASCIVASAGTDALPALKHRSKGGVNDSEGVWLYSAAWLLGRVSVPLFGSGPAPIGCDAFALAARLGFAGVVTTSPSMTVADAAAQTGAPLDEEPTSAR